ncbi:1-deoxy-D-xylulose-5-phosphate reductoisomerase [Aliicoccus persicus]|uniref:1-deoxy-D-xylulose 5-phosphate reductoisomerase n=1 Tax=Aliicoccus persicus TaxID=930138 RepID=A0A662Z0E6_9STAP|nr:1-deoxy-D-xylulose-5-phosphate reductoisomerase [Aliicoccus persicus]SEV81805.1 1-deoxy-D-xylulose 5-phosphate reductoisomerase [Aliicoccus persicus]
MKKISIIGVTGSIGLQTIDVVEKNKSQFKVISIAAGENVDVLRGILSRIDVHRVCMKDETHIATLKLEYPKIEFSYGMNGLLEIAHDESDMLVTAILGSIGIRPTVAAIKQKKEIALANKETLVAAGAIVMDAAKEAGVQILPVDSEHSAIFQCLKGEDKKAIKRLMITASGGSFRDLERHELDKVTLKDALNHPNWSMGKKITIDSATMLNKGLEVIEAKWLFDLEVDQISTILHHESIVHSMVEFVDNSIIAQLGNSDMRHPIQFALTYPDRLPMDNPLDWTQLTQLNFKEMDLNRFKMLQYAYDAIKIGGTMPAVLNAANELAVNEFLQEKISFLEIEQIVENAMNHHQVIQNPDIDTILHVDEVYKNNRF